MTSVWLEIKEVLLILPNRFKGICISKNPITITIDKISLPYYLNKTDEHNFVTYHNRTPTFEWYIVIRCSYENKSQNEMHLKRLDFVLGA